MTPHTAKAINDIASAEARFNMGASESLHDAMYRAITDMLYHIYEVLHPHKPFPSLAEVEFADYGNVVEFYWDGECIVDHKTMMAFCKARKCTLTQVRSAFSAHDYSPSRLQDAEERALDRHNNGGIVRPKPTTPLLKLTRRL